MNRVEEVIQAVNDVITIDAKSIDQLPRRRCLRIGYIGSPANLQNDAIAEMLHALVRKLQQNGHQLYVGPPNKALEHDGVKVEDMNHAPINMFDIVLIAPGGTDAQHEAQRFDGHAKFFTFTNSSDTRNGSPPWMKNLNVANRFDFHAKQEKDSPPFTSQVGGARDRQRESLEKILFHVKEAQSRYKRAHDILDGRCMPPVPTSNPALTLTRVSSSTPVSTSTSTSAFYTTSASTPVSVLHQEEQDARTKLQQEFETRASQLQKQETELDYTKAALERSGRAEDEKSKLIKQLQSQLDAYDRERAR